MPMPTRPADADSQRPTPSSRLGADERRYLLGAARRAITHAIATGHALRVADLASPVSPSLERPGAAFVTLRAKTRRLRGCIGEILPGRPLLESVLDNAVRAALHDSRFPVVEAEELPELTIEVSVLTRPVAVTSALQIEVGRHGVLLEMDEQRAVFLPQVATEQRWDREQLLTQLSLKAGLDADAWRENAQLSVFEAEKFAEADL